MGENESCKFVKAVGLGQPIFALILFGISEILAPRMEHVTAPATTPTPVNRCKSSLN